MSVASFLPKLPLALFSSITVIDESTTVEQALAWRSELESKYTAFFGGGEPNWTWDDVHDCDLSALVELQEIINARSASGTDSVLCVEMISAFKDQTWRAPYLKELFPIGDYREIGLAVKIKWRQARGISGSGAELSPEEEALLRADWCNALVIQQITKGM